MSSSRKQTHQAQPHAVLDPPGEKASEDSSAGAGNGRPSASHEGTVTKHYLTWNDVGKEIAGVEWLWEAWLPIGMVTLLVGEPGIGKSGLALAIVASVIRGDPWPNGIRAPTPGKAVWVETEAGEQINVGRAKAWALPLDRILVISTEDVFPDGHLDRADTLRNLEEAARQEGVRLVVVDSLRGAHRGDENSSQIVDLMTKLTSLSRDCKVAVLVIHHVRKQQMHDDDGRINLDRVRGSSAILQTPRVAWAVDRPDSSGSEQVRLYQIKNNLATFPHELGFQITEGGLNYSSAPEVPTRLSRRQEAEDFLLRLLADGPVHSAEVIHRAEVEGISQSTLRRAKKVLGIPSVRENGQGNGEWLWSLADAA